MKKMGNKQSKIVYKDNCGTEEIETTENEKNTYSITDNQAVELSKYIYRLSMEEEVNRFL